MITRRLKEYEVTAYHLELVDGKANAEKLGTVTFATTRYTETQARKAFEREGITVPRGSKLEYKELSEKVYRCTDEDFMAIAVPVENVKQAPATKKKTK